MLLSGIECGAVDIRTCELASPSPLAHAILNARPYAFLDDGAAEERRTRAVRTLPLMDASTAADMARLDAQVIAQVCADARPEIGSADELHDALVVHAFLTPDEAPFDDRVAALAQQRRATRLQVNGRNMLVAAERLHHFQALFPGALLSPVIDAVVQLAPDGEDALREVLRGRLDLLGPVSAAFLAEPLGLQAADLAVALLQLESEGAVMRGAFTNPAADEWCDRRLLARMHRATRDKQRAEIRPVAPAQFMRFLLRWHQLGAVDGGESRRAGEAGLADVLRQLEGHSAPAAAWEEDLLPARVTDYTPDMLDRLCAAGKVAWWRPGTSGEGGARGLIRATPVMLCERESLAHWQQLGGAVDEDAASLSGKARRVRDALQAHGASFFADLQHDAGLLGTELEAALAELVAAGLATCDSFAGLRALVMPADKRSRLRRRRPGHEPIDDAGRWSLTRRARARADALGALAAPHVEHIARVLLRRYGVVFRKLLEREDGLPPWRELHYVLRRLEARGEVRGGRFVSGFSGEQFALPEAATALRKAAPAGERVCISALDPLNLVGILTPGDKLPRIAGNRLVFEDGVPIALHSGGDVHYLAELDGAAQWELKNLLIRRQRQGSYLNAAHTRPS